jgi:hypothetical protein
MLLLDGHAISIGTVACAAKISQVLKGFSQVGLLMDTLAQYGLPTTMHFGYKASDGIDAKR